MSSGTQIAEMTDGRGRLMMAGLHDAQLTKLTYISRQSLEYSLLGQNREATNVLITKPLILNLASLWEGSIVDSIFVWRLQSVPPQIWDDPENGWHALFDQRVDETDRRREAERLTRLYPLFFLIVVSCSYGGKWAVVSEDVSISKTPDNTEVL